MCIHCERVAKQDDAKLLTQSQEIKVMLETVEAEQAQVAELTNSPIDASIPITFTKVSRGFDVVNATIYNNCRCFRTIIFTIVSVQTVIAVQPINLCRRFRTIASTSGPRSRCGW